MHQEFVPLKRAIESGNTNDAIQRFGKFCKAFREEILSETPQTFFAKIVKKQTPLEAGTDNFRYLIKSGILTKIPWAEFVQSITQNNEFKAFPHKLGYTITFTSAEQCMAFWRTLNICRLKGFLLKGMISIQKIQNKPSPIGRSHSMTFQQRKKKNTKKPEKLPQLQIIYTMKDNDFPPLN